MVHGMEWAADVTFEQQKKLLLAEAWACECNDFREEGRETLASGQRGSAQLVSENGDRSVCWSRSKAAGAAGVSLRRQRHRRGS